MQQTRDSFDITFLNLVPKDFLLPIFSKVNRGIGQNPDEFGI